MAEHKLIYHGIVSRFSTLAVDLAVMRDAGFDGLELLGAKVRNVLSAGFSEAEVTELLKGVEIPGIGFLKDIERTGDAEAALFAEAEEIFRLAVLAGAKAVQIITGPLSLEAVTAFASGKNSGLYEGTIRLPRQEQIAVSARNLSRLADLAKGYGLLLYLEALSWAPLNRLADQVELLERTDRDNVRLVIDYWHCYSSGDLPEDVARIDGSLIYGVHLCDSLEHDGSIPNEVVLRDVPTGEGVLNLREWTQAVKATGYKGWWSCETFCRRQYQDDSFVVARKLHGLMSDLVLNS